jgi:hypothetical protein
MKRNAYLMSKVVIVAALAAGAVGVANADMGRFDSGYAYFNKYPFDKAPSAWRKDHPSGLSEQQLQADSGSSVSSAWKIDKPPLDKAPSDFRLTHPNGPSECELQALSSDGPAWHTQAAPTAVASSGQTDVAQGARRETLAARLARIFSPAKQDAQAC